ncbi:MAG TPA: Yip1 family protein [Woeseiaceae bacterium]|nr:Yip1 family protein [Woeseiaceae bacterium]
MFDPKRTLDLIKGALLNAEPTWQAYLPEAGDWKKTAFLLTGPLIIASSLIAYLFGFTVDDSSIFGMFRPTLLSTLLNIVFSGVAIGIFAFILSSLAGAFGGTNSFPLAFAAASFAFVPAYVGRALTWLPWIGGLLSIVLFIYALILLWRILPIYLNLPTEKRTLHYILSLVAGIVLSLIIGATFGRFMPGADMGKRLGESGFSSDPGKSASQSSGIIGTAMRQAEIMAAAEEDEYDPPSDGELNDKQVKEFIRVMVRASEMRASKEQRLKEIAEKADKKEQVSFSDITEMMGGVADMTGMAGAEMELVKSAGGNWAEHVWVRDSLRTAWLQKDINAAVKHNYKMYQKYESELAPYIAK